MQVNQSLINKLQSIELRLSDYLYDARGYEHDPLEDAHCAIISVMRELNVPLLEVAKIQVNQGEKNHV